MYQLHVWFPQETYARKYVSVPTARAALNVLPHLLVERPDCERIEVRFGNTLLFKAKPHTAVGPESVTAAP